MSSSRSSRRFACSVAATIVLAVVGCATDNGDFDDPNEVEDYDPPPKTKEPDDPQPPGFDASIDEEDPEPEPWDGEDPTPPDGDQCLDPDDAGSSENTAKALPATDDCDNNYKVVEGIANGAVDVDFYSLSMKDKTGCVIQQDFEARPAGVEMCVYVRCQNSKPDAFKGCKEGVADTNGIGMKGCCAAAPGRAVPDWSCAKGLGMDDSADFFIRMRQINGDQCLPYEFRYRF